MAVCYPPRLSAPCSSPLPLIPVSRLRQSASRSAFFCERVRFIGADGIHSALNDLMRQKSGQVQGQEFQTKSSRKGSGWPWISVAPSEVTGVDIGGKSMDMEKEVYTPKLEHERSVLSSEAAVFPLVHRNLTLENFLPPGIPVKICAILSKYGWSAHTLLELRTLIATGTKVKAKHVLDVLNRQRDADVAYYFLVWSLEEAECRVHISCFTVVIRLLGRVRKYDLMEKLLKDLDNRGYVMDKIVFTSAMRCYAEGQRIQEALELFVKMKESGLKPDCVTYSVLMRMLFKAKLHQEALNLYNEMLAQGVAIDTQVYNCVVNIFGKPCRLDLAYEKLEEMRARGHIPDQFTYVVEGYAKAGRPEFMDLYREMKSAALGDGLETLLSKRAAFPRSCAQNFKNNKCTPEATSSLILRSSACFRGPTSSRKLILGLPSRSPAGGGHCDEGCQISLPWLQRSQGLRCRAYKDGSDNEAGAADENTVLKVIRALGAFVNANFLIVGWCSYVFPFILGLQSISSQDMLLSGSAEACFSKYTFLCAPAIVLTGVSSFVLSALSSSVIFGLALPYPGRAAQKMGLTKLCTSAIFLLSGMNIRSGDAEQGIAAWPAGLFGLVSILLITPLAAIPILAMQSSPRELVAGLAIFSCAPTTLSSAVCLTQIAGANTTLAIGMTVLSNLLSVVTMPFTLTTFVGKGIGVSIPPGQLLQSLLQTLLVPLVLGKVKSQLLWSVLRERWSCYLLHAVVPGWSLLAFCLCLRRYGHNSHRFLVPENLEDHLPQVLMVGVSWLILLHQIIRETFSDVAKLVDGNRRQVAMLTASFQSMVPWMQISTSRAMLLQIEPSNLLLISAAGLVLHIVYLATNFLLMKFLPWRSFRDDYNSRAVLLVTSQKSIVVSIAVIDRLGGAFGNAGVLVLPCIAAQFSQVITDSILVNGWVQNDEGVEKSLMSCML